MADDNNDLCVISQEAIVTPAATMCGHTFDYAALQEFVNNAQEVIPVCPCCRGQIFDFATHKIPVTVGKPPLLFSKLEHNLNLNNPRVVGLLYTETCLNGVKLLANVKDNVTTPAERNAYFHKRLALFSVPKQDKEHLPQLMQSYSAVAELHQALLNK